VEVVAAKEHGTAMEDSIPGLADLEGVDLQEQQAPMEPAAEVVVILPEGLV
jgi:hypothetical protein